MDTQTHIIKPGYILPSAAFNIPAKNIKSYIFTDKNPEIGDLVYGKIKRLGQHGEIENKNGRLHKIIDGRCTIFVMGNRYAPDYYEAIIPENFSKTIDVISRSGMIGNVLNKNEQIKDPTKIEILGYVLDDKNQIINTRNYYCNSNKNTNSSFPTNSHRAKLILIVGTSMNSGKSQTCSSICWSLCSMGHKVRASKITGTASLKDILHMEDAGAERISDFTHLGYPSTYLLSEEQLLDIFNTLDNKYANNPSKFWIVEIADGLLQKETAMLLANPIIQKRIHKLIFSAYDSIGALGGIKMLKNQFNLIPDAISGICSSSPLSIKEISQETSIPVINNLYPNIQQVFSIING